MPPVSSRLLAVAGRRSARAGARAGLTLLELVVVLALLGLVAAIVLPSFAAQSREATVEDVVRAARSTAILRAQSLTLRVGAEGTWVLVAPGSGSTIAQGRLGSGADMFALELSPLGQCTLRPPIPASLAHWDVARCARRGGNS